MINRPYGKKNLNLLISPEPCLRSPFQLFKKIGSLVFLGVWMTALLAAQSWQPPLGIPRPSFGIEETYRMYDNPVNRNPALVYTQNAEGGFYTHYIDNTHAQAIDAGNPFGTAVNPRLTIPTSLPAGSMVELHGGPYVYSTSGQSGAAYVFGAGSSNQPIFIRGFTPQSKTVFSNCLRIRGSYIVLENILFAGPQPGGMSVRAPSDHLAVRHTEATELTHVDQGNIYDIAPAGNDEIDFNEDIVFYANHIHDNGFPAPDASYLKNDFQISGNSRRVWIVDNVMENGSEDAIHIIYYHDARYIPEHIYVGRNAIHHYSENAIDVKPSRNVIISENNMYGFRPIDIPPSDGSDGAAVCFNFEAGAPEGQTIENHYLIFNSIHDSEQGVRAEYGVMVFGNRFYNINPTIADTNSGVVSINGGSPVIVANNTMHNVWRGVYHRKGSEIHVINNIIFSASDAHIQYQNVADAIREFRNNLFWNADGKAVLKVGGSGAQYFRGISTFPNPSEFSGSFEANPLFVSSDWNHPDYMKLTAVSPAIDCAISTGPVQELLTNFLNVFALNIAMDSAGGVRPQGEAWDIGAYEYVSDVSQSITLHPGWNWISFNVLPADRSLSSIFSGILGQVEQVRTQTQSALRLNGNWMGDLINMDEIQNGKMYKVRVNSTCTLTVTGSRIASATPIALVSGWNWVAFYPVSPLPIGQALASISGQVQQAKSQTQSAIYNTGSWLGDLAQLEPGKGYTILMSGTGALAYPEGQ